MAAREIVLVGLDRALVLICERALAVLLLIDCVVLSRLFIWNAGTLYDAGQEVVLVCVVIGGFVFFAYVSGRTWRRGEGHPEPPDPGWKLIATVAAQAIALVGLFAVYYYLQRGSHGLEQLKTPSDAVYYAVGTFSTAGAPSVTGEPLRGLVLIQESVDFAFVSVIVAMAVGRLAGAAD
jgi:hypothetical protein